MELRDAIELLQSDPDVRLISVDAHRGTSNDEDDDDDGGGGQHMMFAWFPRFVEAVENHPRLEGIQLNNFRFDGSRLEDHQHHRHRVDPPDGNIHLNDNPNHNHNDHRPSSIIEAIRFWWEGLWRGGHNEPMPMPPPPPPQLPPLPWPLPPHHPAHANNRVAWATKHLFRTVLPCHRTVHSIILNHCCGIEPRHIESFFEAIVVNRNSNNHSDNDDVNNNDDPHHELRALCFVSCRLEDESIRHIATALARTNVVRIRDLRVGGRQQRWTTASLRLLCDGAARNRPLVGLSLTHITLEEERRRRRNRNDDDDDVVVENGENENEYVTADIFKNLLLGCSGGSSSSSNGPTRRPSLRHLTLTHEPCFDPDFFEELMTMLRTNDVLESLTYHHLVHPLRDLEILHDELLSRYNFTLQHVEVGASMPDHELYVSARAQIVQTLHRNNSLWASYDHMRQVGVPEIIVVLDDIVVPRRDHDDDDVSVDDAVVDDTNRRRLLLPLWPEAIARIHSFPTLLYRFLRKDGNSGNSNAVRLVEHLHQQRRSAEGGQQRRSRRRDEDGGSVV